MTDTRILHIFIREVVNEFGDVEYISGEKSDVAKKWKIDGFDGTFGIIGNISYILKVVLNLTITQDQ